MARYFFHVRYKPGPGGISEDLEGDDLPNIASARDHALMVARDLIDRTRISAVRSWFDCSFEITDGQGRAIMTVPFSDAISEQIYNEKE